MLPEVMAPDIGTDCAIPMRWGDGREQSDCDASGKKKADMATEFRSATKGHLRHSATQEGRALMSSSR
jgi:hypothetical protein